MAKSITIRAAVLSAVIGGAFGILTFSLPYIINAVRSVLVSRSPDQFVLQRITFPNPADERRLLDAIAQSAGLGNRKLTFMQDERFDFAGGGFNAEYIFQVRDPEFKLFPNGIATFSGIITTRTSPPQLIYYDEEPLGDSIQYTPFYVGRTPYLLVCDQAGSGNYLMCKILTWDGIRPPEVKWQTESALGGGEYFIEAGRLLIRGNNQRYFLEHDRSGFHLLRYADRYQNTGASATHVLRIDTSSSRLRFKYDNKPVEFKTDDEMSDIAAPIPTHRSDIVILDDNFVDQHRYVRFLVDDRSSDIANGFFDHLYFLKTGRIMLYVSDTYSHWYEIPFDVQN